MGLCYSSSTAVPGHIRRGTIVQTPVEATVLASRQQGHRRRGTNVQVLDEGPKPLEVETTQTHFEAVPLEGEGGWTPFLIASVEPVIPSDTITPTSMTRPLSHSETL